MSFVMWMTGLPCSGKSTIAKKLRIVVKKRDVERRKKMNQKDDTPKKSKKMLQRATIT